MTRQAQRRLRVGAGVAVCGGGAIASLDGEADVILPLLLLLLLLQLLLEGTGLQGVLGGGIAACPVLLLGGAPLWM